VDIDRLSIRRGLILALDSAERSNNAHQPAPNKTYPILPAPASAMALDERSASRSMCLRKICTDQSRFLMRAEQQANQSDYSRVRLKQQPPASDSETSSFT